MTPMCAMLGGVPLMIGAGTGAELRQPLGFAMVGGLIVSQLMTLFTTPVVYIYLDGLTRWLARQRAKYWPARRGEETPHAATTASLPQARRSPRLDASVWGQLGWSDVNL